MAKEKEEAEKLNADEVRFTMSLSEDSRTFSIKIEAAEAMDRGEIVLALESFLYENILEGEPRSEFELEH